MSQLRRILAGEQDRRIQQGDAFLNGTYAKNELQRNVYALNK